MIKCEFSLIFLIKKKEMIDFIRLINNSVTIRLSVFITKYIRNHIIKNNQYFGVFYLDCILQYFYKHHSYHSSIQ